MKNNINIFVNLLLNVKRAGIDELINYIKGSDFYTAPASTRYHLSVEGGLLQHSLNVYKALKSLLSDDGSGNFKWIIDGIEVACLTHESVIVIALLHDICKVHSYTTEKRNRKNEFGEWEQYDFYVPEDKFPYGHGEKSVLMISNFIKLTAEEQMAIRWHMGFPDDWAGKTAYGAAVEKYPIILATNTADMIASRIMEDKESNNDLFD